MITDSDHLHHPAWVPSLLSGQTTSPHRLASSDDIRPVDRPIGISDAWDDVLKRSSQVAATEAPTCLQGESGTGKEVIARFIHRLSPRRRGPFVAIELRAVPEHLLESELFGFERGAFTGAHQSKPGQIELAAGGVLLLDEVTEMTPAAQAKFLRVLQNREFRRLGGTRPVRVDVPTIAATNRNLDEAVASGEFRADLYYRLNVFDIRIQPLRERRDDILPLAAGFLRELAGPSVKLTPKAMEALRRHGWPGNVRELRNVLERAVIMCDGRVIEVGQLSLRPREDVPPLRTMDLGARATSRRTSHASHRWQQDEGGQTARHFADATVRPPQEVGVRERVSDRATCCESRASVLQRAASFFGSWYRPTR
jgi:DNA-binding NtrC family response regulator